MKGQHPPPVVAAGLCVWTQHEKYFGSVQMHFDDGMIIDGAEI